MEEILLGAGLICLVGAITGAEVKGFGLEIPPQKSTVSRLFLGFLALLLIAFSQAERLSDYFALRHEFASTGGASTQQQPIPTKSMPSSEWAIDKINEGPDFSEYFDQRQKDFRANRNDAISDRQTQSKPLKSMFRPCKQGTWNVVVASGFWTQEGVELIANAYRQIHPQFEFRVLTIFGVRRESVIEYIIVAGHGLSHAEADDLALRLRAAEVGSNIYAALQPREVECSEVAARK